MRAVVVGVMVVLLLPALARAGPTLTCRDGVLANMKTPGGKVIGVCDEDEKVDGVCTFSFPEIPPLACDTLIVCPSATVQLPVGLGRVVPIKAGGFLLRCVEAPS